MKPYPSAASQGRAIDREFSRVRPFAPGDRVTATLYGAEKRGTVAHVRSRAIVWVVWDGATQPRWAVTESLTLLPNPGA